MAGVDDGSGPAVQEVRLAVTMVGGVSLSIGMAGRLVRSPMWSRRPVARTACPDRRRTGPGTATSRIRPRSSVPATETSWTSWTSAAGGWFSFNVNMTGPGESGNIYVHLREVSGRFDEWYVAAAAVKKEMLATALTAISAPLQVSCYLTTTAQYGTINRLFVAR